MLRLLKKIGNRLPMIVIAVPYSELRVEWQPANKVNPSLRLYSKRSLTLIEWRFNLSISWVSMLFLNSWRVSSHIVRYNTNPLAIEKQHWHSREAEIVKNIFTPRTRSGKSTLCMQKEANIRLIFFCTKCRKKQIWYKRKHVTHNFHKF
jgi:hypothetical protein